MRDLPPHVIERLEQPDSINDWYVLVEIRATDGDTFRLTPNPDPVTFDGRTYLYYPLELGEVTEDTEGRIASVELHLGLVSPEVKKLIRSKEDLVDADVVIIIVPKESVNDPLAAITTAYKVDASPGGDSVLSLKLGHSNLYDSAVPGRRYNSRVCSWPYKSLKCGYIGTLPTCDKTLAGADGCLIHGDDDLANGREVLHPKRFGGFPGMIRRPV